MKTKMKRSEEINNRYGYDTASNLQAICESEESDKVVEFKRLEQFTDDFIWLQQNLEIAGVYYQDNELVALDTNGNTIENILINE